MAVDHERIEVADVAHAFAVLRAHAILAPQQERLREQHHRYAQNGHNDEHDLYIILFSSR